MKELKELFLHIADLLDGDWDGEGIKSSQYDALQAAYEKAVFVNPCMKWYNDAVQERNSQL